MTCSKECLDCIWDRIETTKAKCGNPEIVTTKCGFPNDICDGECYKCSDYVATTVRHVCAKERH